MFEQLDDLSVITLDVICCKIFFDAVFSNAHTISRRKSFLLCGIQILMYYIILNLFGNHFWTKELAVALSMTAVMHFLKNINQLDINGALEEELKQQRGKSHEYRNHILCIENLIKNKDYENLEKYIADLSEFVYTEKQVIDTNNVIVNTILNEKYYEMTEKGIVFVLRMNDLSNIHLKSEDLVVVLSNLLNNAIEACEKCCGEKYIKLKFMTEGDFIILSVKNTSSVSVLIENGIYKTSKVSAIEEHGVGIRNIQRVVEKYGGTYSIKNSEKEFYFAILFPIHFAMQIL